MSLLRELCRHIQPLSFNARLTEPWHTSRVREAPAELLFEPETTSCEASAVRREPHSLLGKQRLNPPSFPKSIRQRLRNDFARRSQSCVDHPPRRLTSGAVFEQRHIRDRIARGEFRRGLCFRLSHDAVC